MGLLRQARQAGCRHSRSCLHQCQNNHIVHRTRTVANATGVNLTNASIHVIANAVGVRIGLTRTAALAKRVKLVCRRSRNHLLGCLNIRIRRSAWTIAHATGVELSDTWVDVVADAIGVRIGLTRSAALAEGIKLVAVAVAVSGRDAVSATDAALVKDVSVAVAIAFRDVGTAAVVNLAWSVALAARVKLANTWVNIVTDAVGVNIGLTRTATFSEGVKLVSSTIAVV